MLEWYFDNQTWRHESDTLSLASFRVCDVLRVGAIATVFQLVSVSSACHSSDEILRKDTPQLIVLYLPCSIETADEGKNISRECIESTR